MHSIIGFVAFDSKQTETPQEGELSKVEMCSLGDFKLMVESGEQILSSDIGFFALTRQKMGGRGGLD